jgi:hypothetical protein
MIMEKQVSSKMVSQIERRLHPVRLSVGYLNNLLESARGGTVTADRNLLYSITSTLEIFIEDFETQFLGGQAGSDDRKGGDRETKETPRVTQTRVG